MDGSGPSRSKRTREAANEPLQFNFKEPEVGQREIATNRRVGRVAKSFAWGMAAIAVGVGAMSLLPNFF